jgi:hypothetical protein
MPSGSSRARDSGPALFFSRQNTEQDAGFQPDVFMLSRDRKNYEPAQRSSTCDLEDASVTLDPDIKGSLASGSLTSKA